MPIRPRIRLAVATIGALVAAGCVGPSRRVATPAAAVAVAQAPVANAPAIQQCDLTIAAADDPPIQRLEVNGPVVSSLPAPQSATISVDLGSALEIAAGQNPQVAFAQQRIREASAQLRAADVLWVPSIRAGLNHNKHEGRIQDVEGSVIDVSRGALYSGLGANAVGAGSPAVPGVLMSFHTRDAVFQPRIAERSLAARREASQAVLQDTLTDTAVAYTNLLEAQQYRAVAQETLANLQRLGDLTGSFARTGEGLQSDADRVRAEVLQQQIEVARAEENVQVASARLAQLLSQDPTSTFLPQEAAIAPLEFVQFDLPMSELIATGLSNRPELAENRFLVAAAVERLRRECCAPLVPSVLLGVSYGAFGGGVGGELEDFGDRLDLDAVAWWEVRNFGFGEQAARATAQSQLAQARVQQLRVMDQVASEVAQASAQVAARKGQIDLAKQGITAAGDSYRRNSERIRNAQGLPIETLQSVQALNVAQRQYVRAVADYNRAQFYLERALGWPIASPSGR
ncbi:MAG: TolC family protein [Pirellulales bacterium]